MCSVWDFIVGYRRNFPPLKKLTTCVCTWCAVSITVWQAPLSLSVFHHLAVYPSLSINILVVQWAGKAVTWLTESIVASPQQWAQPAPPNSTSDRKPVRGEQEFYSLWDTWLREKWTGRLEGIGGWEMLCSRFCLIVCPCNGTPGTVLRRHVESKLNNSPA